MAEPAAVYQANVPTARRSAVENVFQRARHVMLAAPARPGPASAHLQPELRAVRRQPHPLGLVPWAAVPCRAAVLSKKSAELAACPLERLAATTLDKATIAGLDTPAWAPVNAALAVDHQAPVDRQVLRPLRPLRGQLPHAHPWLP
jgi:hypothetical protein